MSQQNIVFNQQNITNDKHSFKPSL